MAKIYLFPTKLIPSWLKVHRLGREHLFHQMREKYDWGYIKACEVIEAELRR